MKFRLTKEEYEALGDGAKEFYVVSGEGYAIDTDVTQSDDYQKLFNNRNDVLDEKKNEEKKRLALEEEQEKAKLKGLEDKQEYEKILDIKEGKHKDALSTARGESARLKLQLENSILNASVESIAYGLAGERAELIKPHLRARMRMVEVDGIQKLMITATDGTDSQMTKEQLVEEFTKNDLYAPLLAGRDSSGGGSDNGGGGTPGNDFSQWEDHFKPETRNLTKQSELAKTDPDLYKRLAEKYNSQGRARVFRQGGR